MLRVWLPLTKDLRNQGLSNCTIEEVTTAAFDNNGKLGKALSAGKIRIPASEVGNIFNNDAMSIAFWYNNNTTNTTGSHSICGFSGNSEGDSGAVRTWDFFNYSTPNNFHWSMSNLGGGSLANIFPANTWVHVCVTWSTPTLKIYMDGVLKYTGSGSSNYTFDKSYYISFGNTPQKMNDFRIYDHCLSPMEVKELAKGLVLHYPLNRQGWGQENLAKNTHGVIIDRLGSTPGSRYEYYAFNCGTSFSVNAGDTVTISFDLYETVNTAGNGHLYVYNTNNKGPHQIAGVNVLAGRTIAVGDIIDERISFTTTVSNRSDATQTNDFIEFYSTYGTSNWFKISNLKIEKGSVATPWCPNSADELATTMGLNGTTEYDCSGYCNNGTRTGTFSWTSDTPKYAVSTSFEAAANIIEAPGWYDTNNESTDFSIATWVKAIDTANCNLGMGLISLYSMNTGIIQITIHKTDGSVLGYKRSKADGIIANQWCHIVAVYSETEKKIYIYKNGVLWDSFSIVANIPFSATYKIKCGNDNGALLSDYRVYATALSADDIKSLYQNSAYIDSSGNVYGAVHSEV